MNPLFLLQGIGMATAGLLAVLVWRSRRKVPATYFLWGGLSWFAANLAKSVASASMPQTISRVRAAAPEALAEPLLWLYVGLLTGVFESGVSLCVVYLIKRIRTSSWREAVGYGLGFGAAEAMLLGIYSTVIVTLVIMIPDQLPPELLELADPGNASLLAIPVPIVERGVVLLLHAFSSILIVYAVQRQEWRWFWASFLYKTAMDTLAGYIQISYGVQNLTLGGAWLVELLLLPFGVVALWGLIALRDRWRTVVLEED
jgi:uncharacterized membrane protein YhfC